MRIIATGCAGLCVLFSVGEAVAQPRLSDASPVAAPAPEALNPRWVRKPTPQEFQRNFPDRALSMGKAGRVVMSCKITAAGMLDKCEVISETPTGLGFGKAALAMAGLFRLVGEVEGQSITVPIVFGLN